MPFAVSGPLFLWTILMAASQIWSKPAPYEIFHSAAFRTTFLHDEKVLSPWAADLVMSSISLLLWSLLLTAIGSIAIFRIDHANNADQERKKVERKQYISKLIQTKALSVDDINNLPCSGSDCCICLEPFKEGDVISESPNCSHIFHADEMETWLLRNDNCPLCKGTYLARDSTPHVKPLPLSRQTVAAETITGIISHLAGPMGEDDRGVMEEFPPWIVLTGSM